MAISQNCPRQINYTISIYHHPPKEYAASMGYFRRIGGMTALNKVEISMGKNRGCLCAGEEWPDKKLKQLEDSAIPGRALCLPNLGVFV